MDAQRNRVELRKAANRVAQARYRAKKVAQDPDGYRSKMNQQKAESRQRCLARDPEAFRARERSRSRARYASSPEAHRQRIKRYRQKDPTKTKEISLKASLKYAYGIELEEYLALLQAQAGMCRVCLKAPVRGRLQVDHCHVTGRVRGLLCALCNKAIGLLKDDPEAAVRVAAYLREGGQ